LGDGARERSIEEFRRPPKSEVRTLDFIASATLPTLRAIPSDFSSFIASSCSHYTLQNFLTLGNESLGESGDEDENKTKTAGFGRSVVHAALVGVAVLSWPSVTTRSVPIVIRANII
jgi:hypothetical protein